MRYHMTNIDYASPIPSPTEIIQGALRGNACSKQLHHLLLPDTD